MAAEFERIRAELNQQQRLLHQQLCEVATHTTDLSREKKVLADSSHFYKEQQRLFGLGLRACALGDIPILKHIFTQDKACVDEFIALCPLHVAAETGQLSVITYLVESGISVAQKNAKDKRALELAEEQDNKAALKLLKEYESLAEVQQRFLHAAALGHAKELQEALSDGALINGVDGNGFNALQLSIAYRREATTTVLMASKINFGHQTQNCKTAVRLALECGNVKLAQQLSQQPASKTLLLAFTVEEVTLALEQGADVNAIDDEGFNILQRCIFRKASFDIIETLVQAGIYLDHAQNKLHATTHALASAHHPSALGLLQRKFPDLAVLEKRCLDGERDRKEKRDKKAVEFAETACAHVVEPAPLDSPVEQQLLEASTAGDVAAIQSALAKGACIHAVNEHGYNGFQLAIIHQRTDAISFFEGSSIHLGHQSLDRATAIRLALSIGNRDLAHRLSNRPVNGLLLNAAASGDILRVKQAISEGADINAIEQNSCNALELCVLYERPADIAQALIEAGIHLEYRGHVQKTALELASVRKRTDVEMLAETHSFSILARNRKFIRQEKVRNEEDLMRLFKIPTLFNYQTNVQDHYLLVGAFQGNLLQVKSALASGASLRSVEVNGYNALQLGIASNNPEVYQFLYEQPGIQLGHQSGLRYTAVQLALNKGNIAFALQLSRRPASFALLNAAFHGDLKKAQEAIAQNADINAIEETGHWNSLDLAVLQGHPLAFIQCLLEAGINLSYQGNCWSRTALSLSTYVPNRSYAWGPIHTITLERQAEVLQGESSQARYNQVRSAMKEEALFLATARAFPPLLKAATQGSVSELAALVSAPSLDSLRRGQALQWAILYARPIAHLKILFQQNILHYRDNILNQPFEQLVEEQFGSKAKENFCRLIQKPQPPTPRQVLLEYKKWVFKLEDYLSHYPQPNERVSAIQSWYMKASHFSLGATAGALLAKQLLEIKDAALHWLFVEHFKRHFLLYQMLDVGIDLLEQTQRAYPKDFVFPRKDLELASVCWAFKNKAIQHADSLSYLTEIYPLDHSKVLNYLRTNPETVRLYQTAWTLFLTEPSTLPLCRTLEDVDFKKMQEQFNEVLMSLIAYQRQAFNSGLTDEEPNFSQLLSEAVVKELLKQYEMYQRSIEDKLEYECLKVGLISEELHRAQREVTISLCSLDRAEAQYHEEVRSARKHARRKKRRRMVQSLAGVAVAAWLAPILAPKIVGSLLTTQAFSGLAVYKVGLITATKGTLFGIISSGVGGHHNNLLRSGLEGALFASMGHFIGSQGIFKGKDLFTQTLKEVSIASNAALLQTVLHGGPLFKNLGISMVAATAGSVLTHELPGEIMSAVIRGSVNAGVSALGHNSSLSSALTAAALGAAQSGVQAGGDALAKPTVDRIEKAASIKRLETASVSPEHSVHVAKVNPGAVAVSRQVRTSNPMPKSAPPRTHNPNMLKVQRKGLMPDRGILNHSAAESPAHARSFTPMLRSVQTSSLRELASTSQFGKDIHPRELTARYHKINTKRSHDVLGKHNPSLYTVEQAVFSLSSGSDDLFLPVPHAHKGRFNNAAFDWVGEKKMQRERYHQEAAERVADNFATWAAREPRRLHKIAAFFDGVEGSAAWVGDKAQWTGEKLNSATYQFLNNTSAGRAFQKSALLIWDTHPFGAPLHAAVTPLVTKVGKGLGEFWNSLSTKEQYACYAIADVITAGVGGKVIGAFFKLTPRFNLPSTVGRAFTFLGAQQVLSTTLIVGGSTVSGVAVAADSSTHSNNSNIMLGAAVIGGAPLLFHGLRNFKTAKSLNGRELTTSLAGPTPSSSSRPPEMLPMYRKKHGTGGGESKKIQERLHWDTGQDSFPKEHRHRDAKPNPDVSLDRKLQPVMGGPKAPITPGRIYSPADQQLKHHANGHGSTNPIRDPKIAQELLDTGYSVPDTRQVYNVYEGRLIKFQNDGKGKWHAYEVRKDPSRSSIQEQIPDKVILKMRSDGLISKSQAKKWIKNKE